MTGDELEFLHDGPLPGWENARTIPDLARLTVKWLEGSLVQIPSYSGPPEAETSVILEELIRINAAGFMTEFSQPAEMEPGWSQRAAVTGFCEEALGERIQSGLLNTELLVLALRPGDDTIQIPISLDGDEASTWTGARSDEDSIMYEFSHAVHSAAVGSLFLAWQVSVVDMRWGRNDLLWPALIAAVEGG